MENILIFSYMTIMFLLAIIIGSKYAMSAEIKVQYKVIILTILHSIIYWLIYQASNFIQWTIQFDKVQNYPYRYPFCFLVIIYCVLSFIIMGILLRMKHKKDEYPMSTTIIFLLIIHILSILITIKFLIPFTIIKIFF